MCAAEAYAQQLTVPDERGEKLRQFYLDMDVEHLWLAGQHINWETGVADSPDATHNVKTHCSAFVAATCKRLNIYVLRPPDHAQGLLANAQYDWLKTPEAAGKGWKAINEKDKYWTAQNYANTGYVVIAVCKNPDKHKPGHAALVMPAKLTLSELSETGPKLIQAGSKNYNCVSLKEGFKHHITQWPENEIALYVYSKSVF
jgi:hypothetical protein